MKTKIKEQKRKYLTVINYEPTGKGYKSEWEVIRYDGMVIKRFLNKNAANNYIKYLINQENLTDNIKPDINNNKD